MTRRDFAVFLALALASWLAYDASGLLFAVFFPMENCHA